MLRLPCIFSSDALYQADSILTVHGVTDTARPVRAAFLAPDGSVFAEA